MRGADATAFPGAVRAGEAGSSPLVERLRPTFGQEAQLALQESQAECDELHAEVALLRRQQQNLERVVEEQQQVIDAAEQQLQQDWMAADQERMEQTRLIEHLQAQVDQQQRRLEASEGMHARLAAANTGLQERLGVATSRLEQQERELEAKERLKADLDAAVRKQEQLEQGMRDGEALEEALRNKAHDCVGLERENERLRAQFAAELDQFQQEAVRNVTGLTVQAAEIQARVQDEVDGIRAEAEARVQQHKTSAAETEQELRRCRGELEKASSDLLRAGDVVKRLQQTLKERTSSIADLEKSVEVIKVESERALQLLHESIEDLNSKYEARGLELEARGLELERIRAQNAMLEKELVLKYKEWTSAKKSASELEAALTTAKSEAKEIADKLAQREKATETVLGQMDVAVHNSLKERESMRSERDQALIQVEALSEHLQRSGEGEASQAILLRSALERQLKLMQEQFRADMASLKSESEKQLAEEAKKHEIRTVTKVLALESTTQELTNEREALLLQLEGVIADDQKAQLSADNRALKMQVQQLEEEVQHLQKLEEASSTRDPEYTDRASPIADPNISDMEAVTSALREKLREALQTIQTLQDQNLDLHEDKDQVERTWKRHALEWSKEADELKSRIKMLEAAEQDGDALREGAGDLQDHRGGDRDDVLDFNGAVASLNLVEMARSCLQDESKLEETRQLVKSYVGTQSEGRSRQEILASFCHLLIRVASSEAKMEAIALEKEQLQQKIPKLLNELERQMAVIEELRVALAGRETDVEHHPMLTKEKKAAQRSAAPSVKHNSKPPQSPSSAPMPDPEVKKEMDALKLELLSVSEALAEASKQDTDLIHGLQNQVGRALQDVASKEEEVKQLQNEIKMLREELSILKAAETEEGVPKIQRTQVTKAQRSAAPPSASAPKETAAQEAEERDSLRQQVEVLHDSLKEYDTLRAENAELLLASKASLATLRAENAELLGELTKLKIVEKTLRGEVASLQEEKAGWSEHIREMTTKMQNSSKANSELERQFKQKEDELAHFKQDLDMKAKTDVADTSSGCQQGGRLVDKLKSVLTSQAMQINTIMSAVVESQKREAQLDNAFSLLEIRDGQPLEFEQRPSELKTETETAAPP